ncbi:hypothetical protein [Brumimicrobium aurantiacum]|uniref:Uncharacterized protein n=1 Tax=Brumimicrobium aurantiacum TaxID=1737063 RepID=A0A3E1EW94_9FLAO|nr:hypothetical protein [Brumimicrobium aurantiacum]RFC53834.1 hypothetical protein DXU93_11960 [Brumimicrobium aurantiacum]
MNNINSYKDLLEEEERLINQIELSKRLLEINIKSYLEPENLFGFFEKKIGHQIRPGMADDFDLKEYLVGLSLDFLYDKITTTLVAKNGSKTKGINIKKIVKSYVDRYYLNNRDKFTEIISAFIDEKIDQLIKK